MLPWLLLGLAAALGIAAVARRGTGAAPGAPGAPAFAYPSYVTGKRLTHAEADDADGFVHVAPSALAAQVGQTVEHHTLTRFLGSEMAGGNPAEKAAIAWSVVNALRKRQRAYPNARWTMLKMATYVAWKVDGQRDGEDTGLYGKQDMNAWRRGANRYASTARDPSDRDAYVATMVLSGAWPDLTHGGDQFLDPRDQRMLHEKNPGTYASVEDKLADWTDNGRKQVRRIPGTDANRLLVIGPRIA